MRFSSWTPSLLPATVRFWNRQFVSRRNWFPLTEGFFRERITSQPNFDPTHLILTKN